MEISRQDSLAAIIQKAAHVVPTSRQIEWQELEFNGFLRFSINTLNGREWGTGPEMKDLIFLIRPDWTSANGSGSSNRKR